MIERDLRTHFLGSTSIADVVESRIYGSRAPQGVRGPLIVLRSVSSDRSYHLQNEAGVKESVVQVDCYDATARKAEELSELVRNRLSGYRGAAGDVTIQAATILSEHAYRESPKDRSDQWVFRYSVDYSITHTQSVPTHT